MASSDNIELHGEITEVLGSGMYRVLANDAQEVITYLSGKMRQNKIQVVLNDKVIIEVSPYDPTRGRITRRKDR